MSFYRIYRPTVIDEIDNVKIQEQLRTLLKKKKKDLPHAFLLSGPKGVGKTTAARVIAKLFNCTKEKKSGPCGTCDQCLSIANGTNMDVMEMDGASNRGIDDIRQLKEGVHLAPSSSAFKIYIIDEVHMLTAEAFNALLKTLEEPPLHAIFILATTDPGKVPVTVRSRCMEVKFSKASPPELEHALSRIIKTEAIDITGDAVAAIVKLSDGAFRDAVKMLEQASFTGGKITEDMVLTILSVSDSGKRKEFLDALLAPDKTPDVKKVIGMITLLSEEGKDFKVFLTDCLSDLEGLLIEQTMGKGDAMDKGQVIRLIRIFTDAYGMMRTCPILQLPIELAVIEFLEEPAKNEGISNSSTPISHPTDLGTTTVHESLGLLTLEKLKEHWGDVIETLKPYNHSVAGVLRSARPKSVGDGKVTIEAYYKFHQERLSESRVRDILASVLKKLFGEQVSIEIVLGKK